ncbi:hypothetical protein [Paracraurococcus ruber]|uniref:hypothetical protein n=1 Tax=Paracraurococcus ruber TaxID=77675 RepID=UPI001EFFF7E6|nr:hypothetical protein [Paracraurococcus ruber]
MLDIDADQFAAAQRPGIAQQQQGAVAQAGEVGAAGPDQAADLGGGQRRRLPGRAGMLAGDAAQRVADRRVAAVEGVPGLAMGAGDGGETPAQGGQGMQPGMGGEVGGDGGRGGRQRRQAGLPVPPTKVAPLAGIGPAASARAM